jgi:type II secretion system protein G
MDRHRLPERSSFTLIELLVVVAIIAILASIAVPNMLEAQTRAKVARVENDLRTLATALESYVVDHNHYPPAFFKFLDSRMHRLRPLTTPIAYITSAPRDPFNSRDPRSTDDVASLWWEGMYAYGAGPIEAESRWILASDGPDRIFGGPQADTDYHLSFIVYPGYQPGMFYALNIGPGGSLVFDYQIYDPTNGSVSQGEIIRASDFHAN